jgi:hypothetical protein
MTPEQWIYFGGYCVLLFSSAFAVTVILLIVADVVSWLWRELTWKN